MPQGKNLQEIERKEGMVIRFIIGHRLLLVNYGIFFILHSGESKNILDRAIDAEDAQYKDFLRLRQRKVAKLGKFCKN
ncbi:beta-1,3-galactosyltransferase 7-like protein [Carex littledalei]|uniref:Beta-1,3-galactosyltransferase 7-like protein n=1 Tax=Carex littledalei TaxID=544730 RepID=A0A833RIR8_9POAL|nr:beta-1,3-galactosyltransferase 7-like protein [Carex littledalei]